jgi:hypothetical protein
MKISASQIKQTFGSIERKAINVSRKRRSKWVGYNPKGHCPF